MKDNKYMVTMRDKVGKSLCVDVYDTLDAFPITCPALQHLTKKALFAGRRGHKDQLQDLLDIRASADRAIELYHSRRIAEEQSGGNAIPDTEKHTCVTVGDRFISNKTGSIVMVTEIDDSGWHIKFADTQYGVEVEWSVSIVGFLLFYTKCANNKVDIPVLDFIPLQQGQKRAENMADMDLSQHCLILYLGSTHSQIKTLGNEPKIFTRLNTDIIEQYPVVIK